MEPTTQQKAPTRLGKTITLGYGLAVYTMFLGVFVYAIGWVGNIFVPTSVDGEALLSLGLALPVDLALLAAFAIQHSVMARPTFKRWWTKIVPPAAERATYVLATNLCMIALFAFWQPLGGVIWDMQGTGLCTALYALYGIGWLVVLVTTFLINHFELFGLAQVWRHFTGRETQPQRFVTPGPYRHVRHPLYVGWLMVFWATPTMTVTHLVLAVAITGYILIAIQLEERNLIDEHGQRYVEYKRQVPMLVPRLTKARVTQGTENA